LSCCFSSMVVPKSAPTFAPMFRAIIAGPRIPG
jgi:hypothetical protein